MWRILPLLAVVGLLEILVPWPEVAALVLSDAARPGAHALSRPQISSPISGDRHSFDTSEERSPLLVQARVTSP